MVGLRAVKQIFSCKGNGNSGGVVKGKGNFYLLPPGANLKDKLRGWNTFVQDSLSWGNFARYSEPIEDVLCDVYVSSGFLNIKYQDRFSDFSHHDIRRMVYIFDTLVTAKNHKRQAFLQSSDIILLDRILSIAGDLSISWISHKYTLSSLASGGD